MNSISSLLALLGQAPKLDSREVHDVPFVGIQMASGARYDGALRESSSEHLVVQSSDGAQHHLDASRVEGITIFDPLAARDVLSGGQEERFSGQKSVPRALRNAS